LWGTHFALLLRCGSSYRPGLNGAVRPWERKLLTILTHNILPVFSVMVLGFAMGRMRFVSNGEARTLNRIAFLILQPALIFPFGQWGGSRQFLF
jgi:hypothetical protein